MKLKEARKDSVQLETKYGEDITYCNDVECPLKNTCGRFALDIFGVYFTNTPRNKSDTTKQFCGFYWPKENKEEVLSTASKYTETQEKISAVYDSLKSLVIYKNEKYGNSALEPLGIFSKNDSTNSILIRLDDKLQRIKNASELRKNDVSDVMGYLCLLCVDKGWTDFEEFKD